MLRRNQNGSVATFTIIIILVLALVATAVFGGWAFMSRQDYKDNFDKKSAAAVAAAKTAQAADLQKQFADQQKLPYKTYKGSPTYGSVSFNYPNIWSGYVDESATNEPINGYFYPGIVPGLQSKAAYALRVELVDSDYSSVLSQHDSEIKDGSAKASAYIPPKMVGVTNVQPGTRLDGALDSGTSGSMAIIKVRDKTLQVYTQSNDFLNDFNNTILPSLTFAP